MRSRVVVHDGFVEGLGLRLHAFEIGQLLAHAVTLGGNEGALGAQLGDRHNALFPAARKSRDTLLLVVELALELGDVLPQGVELTRVGRGLRLLPGPRGFALGLAFLLIRHKRAVPQRGLS